MLLMKRKGDPGLKFNPGLALIGLLTTGPGYLFEHIHNFKSKNLCVKSGLASSANVENDLIFRQ